MNQQASRIRSSFLFGGTQNTESEENAYNEEDCEEEGGCEEFVENLAIIHPPNDNDDNDPAYQVDQSCNPRELYIENLYIYADLTPTCIERRIQTVVANILDGECRKKGACNQNGKANICDPGCSGSCIQPNPGLITEIYSNDNFHINANNTDSENNSQTETVRGTQIITELGKPADLPASQFAKNVDKPDVADATRSSTTVMHAGGRESSRATQTLGPAEVPRDSRAPKTLEPPHEVVETSQPTEGLETKTLAPTESVHTLKATESNTKVHAKHDDPAAAKSNTSLAKADDLGATKSAKTIAHNENVDDSRRSTKNLAKPAESQVDSKATKTNAKQVFRDAAKSIASHGHAHDLGRAKSTETARPSSRTSTRATHSACTCQCCPNLPKHNRSSVSSSVLSQRETIAPQRRSSLQNTRVAQGQGSKCTCALNLKKSSRNNVQVRSCLVKRKCHVAVDHNPSNCLCGACKTNSSQTKKCPPKRVMIVTDRCCRCEKDDGSNLKRASSKSLNSTSFRFSIDGNLSELPRSSLIGNPSTIPQTSITGNLSGIPTTVEEFSKYLENAGTQICSCSKCKAKNNNADAISSRLKSLADQADQAKSKQPTSCSCFDGIKLPPCPPLTSGNPCSNFVPSETFDRAANIEKLRAERKRRKSQSPETKPSQSFIMHVDGTTETLPKPPSDDPPNTSSEREPKRLKVPTIAVEPQKNFCQEQDSKKGAKKTPMSEKIQKIVNEIICFDETMKKKKKLKCNEKDSDKFFLQVLPSDYETYQEDNNTSMLFTWSPLSR